MLWLLSLFSFMAASYTVRNLHSESLFSGILWSPGWEEPFKYILLIVGFASSIRQFKGFSSICSLESLIIISIMIGSIFGVLEHFYSYPNELFEDYIFRLVSHPTFLMLSISTAIMFFLMQYGWIVSNSFGIASGFILHVFYNMSPIVCHTFPETINYRFTVLFVGWFIITVQCLS